MLCRHYAGLGLMVNGSGLGCIGPGYVGFKGLGFRVV